MKKDVGIGVSKINPKLDVEELYKKIFDRNFDSFYLYAKEINEKVSQAKINKFESLTFSRTDPLFDHELISEDEFLTVYDSVKDYTKEVFKGES